MIINIQPTNKIHPNEVVKFKSNIGDGIGVWAGEMPAPDTSIDVELEINDDFTWGGKYKRN